MSYQLRDIDNQLHRIHTNTARGVDDIQDYAMSRAGNETIDKYEKELMQRVSSLKSDINGQLDSFEQDMNSRRPSLNETNYEQKRQQYREFLIHADDGLETMKGSFARLFSKLYEIIKKIVKWITNHWPEIISAIAAIFGSVILPLLGFM